MAVTKEALLQKIESLPPDKRVEVERFVESLAARARAQEPAFSQELFDAIDAARDALLAKHGLIETDSILRELREQGGR